MKKRLLFALFAVAVSLVARAQNPLFDDTRVPSIFVEMPQDSFDFLVENRVNDRYLRARFIFETDGPAAGRDTLESTGIRLRGNTSLAAQKKSFKLSFNEFEAGRKYRGVKKLNLIGSHNDPTMVRQKLFYDIWNRAGLPRRRVSFVKLFVNGAYRGLYSNVEEIDKEWLERVFPDNDGNLYKCTYPADLAPLGPSQAAYKAILNNPTTRAYDLVTNESADDYSGFVRFVLELNKPVNTDFEANIQSVLNVQGYLKALAVEVATGHWDDYSYNKNNYYLYDNPTTGRFEFISYDGDNTLGVDWIGRDWATRDVYAWQKTGEPRPLTTQLLAVPNFKLAYSRYLDTLARQIIHPDSIFPRIDFFENLLAAPAQDDIWRTLDYGYTLADFHAGFAAQVDGHTPYGIKPFLALRRDNILLQIAGMLSSQSPENQSVPGKFRVFPNPAGDQIWLEHDAANASEMLQLEWLDFAGRPLKTTKAPSGLVPMELSMAGLPLGFYAIRISSEKGLLAVVRVAKAMQD
ncbi:MAG: CotH kinase family protein [Saprospiraceae bacterium]